MTAAGAATERIRVLKLVTNFRIGGTERQVINLAQGLDSGRFDLHLGSLRHFGELLGDLDSLRVPRPEFRIGRLYGMKTIWQALRLAQYIEKHLIQIVHTYGFYPNVFAVPAAKCAGSVVVASIRDNGDIMTTAQRYVQRMACRWADCVLVNAESIRTTLIAEGYRADNIVVIRNGIRFSEFDPHRRSLDLRRELNIPPEARLVLVSARLNRMKGIQYFLDAAASIAPRFSDVRFLIVGDGESREELKAQAEQRGIADRTVFTGFRKDIPALLRETTLSVLPSLSEGLSNSVMESMAAGIPVVATRVGGNPEIVDDGVTGWLVPPRDPDALATAMATLLEDPGLAARFGQAARRRVTEMFSVECSVGATQSLYQRLLQAKGPL